MGLPGTGHDLATKHQQSGGSEIQRGTVLLAWKIFLHSQTRALTTYHFCSCLSPEGSTSVSLVEEEALLLHLQLLEPQIELITFFLKPVLNSLFTLSEGANFPLSCVPSSASPCIWSVIQPVN